MPDPSAQLARQTSSTGSTTSQRRILVLGASGFIGQHIVRALAASDFAIPVAAMHRRRLDLPSTVPSLCLDARDAGALRLALHGMDGVVNCITADAPTIVESAAALFEASAAARPLRIVHLSTMMVYGSAQGRVDETAPLLGDWDDYSAAKAKVERMALTCADVVQLRPGIVYGPGSPLWSRSVGRWLLQGRLGDLGVDGEGLCNLVHIDDVVDAVLQALRQQGIEGEAFNLSTPAPPTWNEFFRRYAMALGCPAKAISTYRLRGELYLLAPGLKVLQIVARTMGIPRNTPEPIRPWLRRLCRHTICLDVGKAERVLGMRWRPLEQGLRETADWFLSTAKA